MGKDFKSGIAKAAGAFQAFKLDSKVLQGVIRKGYKNPTPIQRKCIPIILEGKDVVAMARTGSGKTACFLLPILNFLKEHDTCGPRALIISPTRELAMQTFQFFKELAKYTGLRACIILGGTSMDKNFESLHSQPDVIIASPGRLMHVLVEMEMKLTNIKHFVLDEADRLFELGFYDQIKVISKQTSQARQTLLFSATLPQAVTEFSRIGLHDPVLIRLDKDERLSENLKTHYFHVRSVERIPLMLYLVNKKFSTEDKTAIFLPTKHYVEYVHELLNSMNISNSYVYSALDQQARLENVQKFRDGVCSILLVTDIAARGIDIPVLDNVINFNFPSSPKLFVHRVGRVARGGKSGLALNFVTPEEMGFYIDVQLFLGRKISLVTPETDAEDDNFLGAVNKRLINDYSEKIATKDDMELTTLCQVAENSWIQYWKTCPAACHESVKRAKELFLENLQIHPFLKENAYDDDVQGFLNSLKSYKTQKTIFEINPMKNAVAHEAMQKNRKRYAEQIVSYATKKQRRLEEKSEEAFAEERKAQKAFIPYTSTNQHFEKGLEISQFENEVKSSGYDVIADDEKGIREQRARKVWDTKKKKYVGLNEVKKIKTESGVTIKASYKTGKYDDWLKTRQTFKGSTAEKEEFERFASQSASGKGKRELKGRDQVAKERRIKARKMEFQQRRHEEKKAKKQQSMNKKPSGFKKLKTGKSGKFKKK